jgi:4-amino-4-deoxy-L-arabinose transferase-like glycosyltransferase
MFPGASSLWTMEGRSAVICREMMRSGDYVHPYLFDEEYYDKPLLPYWMIIGLARLLGGLSETAMRLPSMLAGLVAIACTWKIGERRFGPRGGLTAGWLLATCFVFIYWARVAGSDMLNLAAILCAVCWYTERRDDPGLETAAGFFAILAVGAQLKGLIAPALAVLAVAPDLLSQGRWRRHLRASLLPAALPALGLYFVPFLASGSAAGSAYHTSGLGMVFRENIQRFFRPFDHEAPVYVYAEFLPLYALPWTLFLPAVLWRARRWRHLGVESRWPLLASLLIFAFLTASGSRRNYYLLPILPFVMLAVADWIHAAEPFGLRVKIAQWMAGVSVAGLAVFFGVITPILSAHGDSRGLAADIRQVAERQAAWKEWQVVLFDTRPQMGYYLDPVERPRRILNPEELTRALRDHPRTVVVTYVSKTDRVRPLLGPCTTVREKSSLPWSLGQPKVSAQAQVAFIPEN